MAPTGRASAWALVVAFFFVGNGVEPVYWAADVEASAALQLVLKALAIVVFWRLLEAECAPYRVTFPFDIGFLLYSSNFLLLPYYFWRTQRWRGVGKLLGVVAIWFVTYAFWQVVTSVVTPEMTNG